MKKTAKINEMSWQVFDRRRRETDLVIIPTGAVEIYGPHLPMGTDGLVAEKVAEMIAEETGGLIAPLTQLSDSTMLLDLPGTLTVSKETFTQWMDDLITNLLDYGFEKFLFISGHAASVDPINSIMRAHQLNLGIRYAQIDWWRFTAAHGDDIFEEKGYMAHGHASECGTSVMLYLYPELVDMSLATRIEPDAKLYQFSDIVQYVPIILKSPNATVGDAIKGTAEKGEKIVTRCVGRILSFIKTEWENPDEV